MTLTHRLISINQKTEWDNIVKIVPHYFAHTHWYNQAMYAASGRDIFLYVGEAGDFRIICPLSLRQKSKDDCYDITTPYGFSGFSCIGEYSNFFQEWHDYMKQNNFVCGHIALHPFLQKKIAFNEAEIFAGKKAYYLNLNGSLDAIYQNLSNDHRHRLRQWQKERLEVVVSKEQKYRDAFTSMYASSLNSRNAASIYHFGDYAWNLLIESEHAYLLSVVVNEEVAAAAVFILYQGITDYYMLASTDVGRLHARGIIWEGIKLSKEKNMDWLHLGCGIKDNDSLEQFKARFGGQGHVTYALKQIYQEKGYRALCAKYFADPNALQGYFPAYWAS